ncbi:hypothetical protein NDU88_002710 [Pleurodeles waltl]|uniref:Uncharacterized protein n=1 Tax=Pleurodeles waltl TaxID=8319 RepID=A0AAV7KTL1_PLEWA|nr:hypothetical protein NDU88_002710 [Pleurodeles waltl]
MRKQFWTNPGLVCFRRIASLCVEGVGAVGLQLGVGPVNQRGPRTWQQGYPASNPGRRRRLSQGDSALPHPTKDNQCSSWVALGVVSLVVGIQGFPGSSHRRSDCAFPKGCTQSGLPTGQRRGAPRPRVSSVHAVPQPGGTRPRPPSRRPIRHRQAPPPDAPVCTPPFRVGPHPNLALGAARCPIQDRARNLAAILRVPVRAGAHESAGGRPRGHGRTQAAPPVPASHLHCCSETGSLSVQRVPAPPVDRAAASL